MYCAVSRVIILAGYPPRQFITSRGIVYHWHQWSALLSGPQLGPCVSSAAPSGSSLLAYIRDPIALDQQNGMVRDRTGRQRGALPDPNARLRAGRGPCLERQFPGNHPTAPAMDLKFQDGGEKQFHYGNYRDQVATWLPEVRSLDDRLKFRLSVTMGVWSEGDHRDWNVIRAWVESLHPLLLQQVFWRNSLCFFATVRFSLTICAKSNQLFPL